MILTHVSRLNYINIGKPKVNSTVPLLGELVPTLRREVRGGLLKKDIHFPLSNILYSLPYQLFLITAIKTTLIKIG